MPGFSDGGHRRAPKDPAVDHCTAPGAAYLTVKVLIIPFTAWGVPSGASTKQPYP